MPASTAYPQPVAQLPVPSVVYLSPQEVAKLLLSAITLPGIFGDERDVIVKKFNQLQAYCGAGKGLTAYAGHALALIFGPDNIFARFKVQPCVELCDEEGSCCTLVQADILLSVVK